MSVSDKVFISSGLDIEAEDLISESHIDLNVEYQIISYSIKKNKINIVVHDFAKDLTRAAFCDKQINILINDVITYIDVTSIKVKEKDIYNKVKIKGSYHNG